MTGVNMTTGQALFRCAALALTLALTGPAGLHAQPVDLPIPAAQADPLPPGVKVRSTDHGPVYADPRGMTLYGMDMRTLIRWGPNPALYCHDACAAQWEPLLAPPGSRPNIRFPAGFGEAPASATAGAQARRRPGEEILPPGFVSAQKAPDWTIIDGPQGPQWVYKGWHVVYTRKGDQPGSTRFDGADDFTWNTLKYVPPKPHVDTPFSSTVVLISGAYALADDKGRVLFTGRCRSDCEQWRPLAGGMASRGMGDWTVSHAADQPQWFYRGRPVFVSQEDDPTQAPAGGTVLRP
jgi:predicted lipoprotein with Yx(FWY)xxD motif